MVLPGCNLLPHGLLPLYIFEPRYRQMLSDALETDRMFAIGTVDPDGDSDLGEPEVFDHSCAGLVRACVGADDGTSHLVLQGLQRIRFNSWNESDKPYRIAAIDPIQSVDENTEASNALSSRALELVHELIAAGHPAPSPKAIEEIQAVEDPEALADLIAYNLVRDPLRRQELLGMEEVGERLRFVIAELTATGPRFP